MSTRKQPWATIAGRIVLAWVMLVGLVGAVRPAESWACAMSGVRGAAACACAERSAAHDEDGLRRMACCTREESLAPDAALQPTSADDELPPVLAATLLLPELVAVAPRSVPTRRDRGPPGAARPRYLLHERFLL